MRKRVNSLISLLVLTFAAGAVAAQESEVRGLPPEAPRVGTIVTIDVSTNTVFLVRDGEVIRSSKAATGSDKSLRKGTKVWWFRTPRGRYKVLRKVVDPVWTKPDWAFVEKGQKVPPANSPLRKERGTMGKYALDLGDRVMIHGTNDPKSIGQRVSHGCIRLPHDMLKTLWKEVPVGTEVYIYDSDPEMARLKGSEKGINSLELGR